MDSAPEKTLFGDKPTLRITIPGKPISGNAKTRWAAMPVGVNEKGETKYSARGYTTSEAKEFDERVKSIALPAIFRAHWKMPEYCRMDVVLFNIAQDRVNSVKTIEDALQGLAFPNDSRVLDGTIMKRKDDAGPRTEIIIRPVDGKDYGFG